MEVRGDGESAYQMTFTLGSVTLADEGNGLVELQVEGMVNQALAEGLPALPQMSRLLLLPRGSALRIERCQGDDVKHLQLERNHVLTPWQGATVKDVEPVSVEPDKEVYVTDAFVHAANPVNIENLGVMGDRQLFRLTVSPASYNPVTGEILLTTTLTATLTATHSSFVAHRSSQPVRYLVVSRLEFREGLQPFVRWKRQEADRIRRADQDIAGRCVILRNLHDKRLFRFLRLGCFCRGHCNCQQCGQQNCRYFSHHLFSVLI